MRFSDLAVRCKEQQSLYLSNIAEGYGRDSNPDLIHFLHIALGSSNELDTQILIARNEEYITEEEFHQLEDLNDNVMRKLQSLINTRRKYEMQTGQTSKPQKPQNL